MKGVIVKGVGGFYYVETENGLFTCKARGIFKKDGETPVVGDKVRITITDGKEAEGVIEEILLRKNRFIRPPIANVDRLVVVISAAEPKPNLITTDRFLVMAEKAEAEVVLCINKQDIDRENWSGKIKEIYGEIYPICFVSAVKGEGIEGLTYYLKNGKNAFVGPSGVGKSTILNRLESDIEAEVGEVSRKTGRGRHTTRHVEIFTLKSGAMVYDTPGFTSFDVPDAEEGELHRLYPEMRRYIGRCKYDDCRHMAEPGCAVRTAVDLGEIHESRYASYKMQIEEIRNRRNYD